MNRVRSWILTLSLSLALLVTADVGCQVTPTAPAPVPRETVLEEPSSTASSYPAPVAGTVTPPSAADGHPLSPATAVVGGEGYQLWLPAVGISQPTPTVPPPTADPSPVPTPEPTRGPNWPEPLSAPGPSKLGLHVVRNNSPWIMEFIRRVRPAVVKAVDDVGWLSDVKRESPTTVTLGRLAPTHQDMHGDPALAAQAFVAEQLTRYQLNRGVDYWEGWNEPDPNENMAWYAAFEAERVRLLAEQGFKAAVGGFACGVPEWEEFLAFLPAIEAASQYGGILTLHEYGAPTMDYLVGSPLPGWPGYPDRGVLALRYRWWYQEILIPRGLVVPLVISEAGIDGIIMAGQRLGPDGLGWQDFTAYWDDMGLLGGGDGYVQQLAWYDSELQRDDYVIGFTVFTAGGGDQWKSYEVNGILPRLARYVAGVE
jgi:hypothetical protein